MEQVKPILCLDFDGVLHSYKSGWKGADCIPDPPVPGAMLFLEKAVEHFEVCIFSSRSTQNDGKEAMKEWIGKHLVEEFEFLKGRKIFEQLRFPSEKPTAHVSLDDRCILFMGLWPNVEDLTRFEPWYKGAV